MPDISAVMVKELRQRTGAGIMDCKKALEENGGDQEKAVDYIKKKGLAKVAKKAGAIAADGAIHAYVHPGSRLGVLVEINSQTDFVARSDDFKAFADLVGMQIASMGALYVRRDEVPAADVDKQREIFAGQVAEEDKQKGKERPAQVIDKIVGGKVDKWVAESCLEEQPAVTDSDKSIAQVAEELTAKIGEKITIRRFARYELGEGIEKKKEDLAAEVAATLKDA